MGGGLKQLVAAVLLLALMVPRPSMAQTACLDACLNKCSAACDDPSSEGDCEECYITEMGPCVQRCPANEACSFRCVLIKQSCLAGCFAGLPCEASCRTTYSKCRSGCPEASS